MNVFDCMFFYVDFRPDVIDAIGTPLRDRYGTPRSETARNLASFIRGDLEYTEGDSAWDKLLLRNDAIAVCWFADCYPCSINVGVDAGSVGLGYIMDRFARHPLRDPSMYPTRFELQWGLPNIYDISVAARRPRVSNWELATRHVAA